MAVSWPDEVDEILGGDHVMALAYATPAKGTVVLPVTNFAVRDREAGTYAGVNSSVGVWRKLARIRRDPHVALAFHTRTHSLTSRPEFVLVQGRATLSEPVADYPSTIIDNWERMEPWRNVRGLRKWWLRVYALRVAVQIEVERVVVWPDLSCTGAPVVHGAPLTGPAPPQSPPKLGTGPRLDPRRAASSAATLPHALLGWVGGDHFPMVVPVGIAGADERGILLDAPQGLMPPGGRRAGLCAHWFSRGVIGQNQRKHTGWLEDGIYAPHTRANYRFPASRTLYHLVAGAATRRGQRGARRAGFLD